MQIFVVLACMNSHAQVTALQYYYQPKNLLAFADHLWQQQDYERAAGEYLRYLHTGAEMKGYANFRIGRCYVNARHPEKSPAYFETAVNTAATSALQDSARVAYLGALLLNGNKGNNFVEKAASFGGQIRSPQLNLRLENLKALYNLQLSGDEKAAFFEHPATLEKSPEIAELIARKKSLPKKSPFLGGLYSALLPGSGKIYAGRKNDGIYSFMMVAVSGLIAYDGYRKGEFKNFKTWFFGGLSLFFYAGNVYGSAVAVRLENQRKSDQLQHDIKMQIGYWATF